jgi:hypothetical protein
VPLLLLKLTQQPSQKKRNNTFKICTQKGADFFSLGSMRKRLTKNQIITLGVATLAILGCAGLLIAAVLREPPESAPPVVKNVNPTSTAPYTNPLDGTGMEVTPSPGVIAFMIDNHPDARAQQIGLDNARIVYEAPVEGGITRYMALFSLSDVVPKVGAVRSARQYFVQWAGEYGALYWHVGGSPEALATLQKPNSDVHDVNEFWNGSFFWRDQNFDAPHNVFTSSSQWQAYAMAQSFTIKTDWPRWQFNAAPSILISSMATDSLKIVFNSDYVVSWKFNATTSLYERYINNKPMLENGAPITAKTILVQKTNVQTIDNEGRKKIAVDGSGEAVMFSNGLMLKGEWRRSSTEKRTRFYTLANNEMVYAPGTIWIEVVPLGTTVE